VHGEDVPEHYSVLSSGAIDHAHRLAGRGPRVDVPEVLREFLAAPTWTHAERHLAANRADLLAPEALAALRRLTDRHRELVAAYGDHPFFEPDRTLPALAAVLNLAARAAGDPASAPIAPRDPSLLADQVRPTTPADESLPLGYLANRPVPGSSGPFQDGLLWLRQLYLAVLDEDVTHFGPAALLDVVAGKGELEAERAGRGPGAHELHRAHATIALALLGTVGLVPWGPGPAPHDLVAAIDCLTGQDRVALHFIIAEDFRPRFPASLGDLDLLIESIITC